MEKNRYINQNKVFAIFVRDEQNKTAPNVLIRIQKYNITVTFYLCLKVVITVNKLNLIYSKRDCLNEHSLASRSNAEATSVLWFAKM